MMPEPTTIVSRNAVPSASSQGAAQSFQRVAYLAYVLFSHKALDAQKWLVK
jgi:hypothetical protein